MMRRRASNHTGAPLQHHASNQQIEANLQHRRYNRKGFALLAALWLVAAVAALGLEFAVRARARRHAAANMAEWIQAQGSAEAGIHVAASRLTRALREGAPAEGQAPTGLDAWDGVDSIFSHSADIGSGHYTVILRDAASLANINVLSEDEMRALFTALDVDYDAADQLAQAIADWRDADDDPRTRGTERDEYIAQGRMVLPTNQPLLDLETLKAVRGMTPDIYTRVIPYLTSTGSSAVNINAAPVPVLRTLPFTDEAVATLLDLRASGTRITSKQQFYSLMPASLRSAFQRTPRADNRLVFVTSQIIATSTGWAPGGRTHVRAAVTLARNGVTVLMSRRRDA